MRATSKAIAKAVMRAPFHSLRYAARASCATPKKTLVCMAHPDDEILIGGLCSRLVEQGNPSFIVFSDGSANTYRDRLSELKNSYGVLGYAGEIPCLHNEMELYDLAHSSPGEKASEYGLRRLTRMVHHSIGTLKETIMKKGVERMIVPAFEGGHFVHDLAHLVVLKAAQESGVEVYETPQYSLSPVLGRDRKEVEEKLNDKKRPPLEGYAVYRLGIPVEKKKGLCDDSLGIKDGVLGVTLKELKKKNLMRKEHKSQKKSIRGSSYRVTEADFSHEYFLEADVHRDLTLLPRGVLPFYEMCHWRPSRITFATFQEIVRRVSSGR